MHRLKKTTEWLTPLAFIGAALLIWQAVSMSGIVPNYMLPSPVQMVQALIEDFPLLMKHSRATLIEAGLGLLIGVTLGFSAAAVMDAFPTVRRGLYPILVITQTIPPVAIAPLLILWFSYGIAPKVVLVVLVSFFPMAVGLLEGFESVDEDMIRLMKSMKATRLQIFRHVKVPADCRYCVSCGKPVVSAKETEMEFHTDDTLTLCRRCMGDMRISDRYCGRCGERSSLWKEDKENERLRDRVRGSLLGGAAGDALGYAVEFQGEKQIFSEYGTEGIREYELSGAGRKAMISDDTQMTLFTAEAITKWLASRAEGGTERSLGAFALDAYLDWLDTQESSFERAGRPAETDSLMAERGMFSRRAPGFTCLSALEKRRQRGGAAGSFIAGKLNNSKGCGGVMRVAPVGMLKYGGTDRIDREGAELAAITHGNSLGYIPAALLTHIIHGILYSGTERTLRDTVTEALGSVAALFRDDPQIGDFVRLINYAVTLSENCERDLDNIHRLGEGWIGEEALAVAVYCCLRHTYDFSRCIITAVNHKGDSDSTGAIAGNILGAYLGYEAIEEKWKENLELSDVILGVADRLYGELVREPVPASL